MSEVNNIEAAIAAGRKLGALEVVQLTHNDGHSGLVHPADMVYKDRGYQQNEPPAVIASATLLEAESFCAYCQRYKTDGSIYFFNRKRRCFTAILNAPANADSPEWGDHVATYPVSLTEEFQEWCELAKGSVGQAALAEFLEDHVAQIEKPDAGLFIDAVRTIQLHKGVTFDSVVRSNEGLQISYREEIRQTDQYGAPKDITIPERFLLRIPLFEGGQAVSLEVKLRYRLSDGDLTFTLKMVDLPSVIRNAELLLVSRVEATLGTILMGSMDVLGPKRPC